VSALSVARCERLLASFSKHTSLLGLDAEVLRQQMELDREVFTPEDWTEAIQKYRHVPSLLRSFHSMHGLCYRKPHKPPRWPAKILL
jgi:hypothetical protein